MADREAREMPTIPKLAGAEAYIAAWETAVLPVKDDRHGVILHGPTFVDDSARLGVGTVVWRYANVMGGVVTGRNCSIGGCVEIGRGTHIGDDCRIGFGTFLPSNTRIGNRVFIGPGCVFADDRHPQVNNPSYKAQPPVINDDVSIGCGVVVLPGIVIGYGAKIGAGATVTGHVPPLATVVGDAARIPLERP